MNNDKSSHYSDNECNSTDGINVNLSGSGEKIKYYDCDDSSFIFEILDEDIDMKIDSSNMDMKIDNSMDTTDNHNSCTESKINESYDKTNTVNEENYTLNISKDSLSNCYNNSSEKDIKGQIIISAILNYEKKQQYLQDAKINIYKLNGVCPIFIESKLTDKLGRVIFENLSEGCYRIIEIINKNYFDKPKYIKWNEVTISKENTKSSVLIVNNLKTSCKKNRFT